MKFLKIVDLCTTEFDMTNMLNLTGTDIYLQSEVPELIARKTGGREAVY